jgi:hypothetical protein
MFRATVSLSATALFILFINVTDASAITQWSRKYEIQCSLCHTVVPRINYYGERFMRNGYQMPDTQDGDETGKTQSGNVVVDELGNYFGVRINVTPLNVTTNTLTVEGKKQTQVSFGSPNWVQLYVGGSIFKNMSVYIEPELSASGGAGLTWFKVGFHNLFGKAGAANILVGKFSPLEWTSLNGKARMIPPRIEAYTGIVSGSGRGEDSVNVYSGRPAISFYGYGVSRSVGVVYSAGFSPGSQLTEPNQFRHYWGSFRLEQASGPIEGSSVSLMAYSGKDARDTGTVQKTNAFQRYVPAFNIRWKKLDVLGAYVWGKDDNWSLSTVAREQRSSGFTLQAGYPMSDFWFTELQLDDVSFKGLPASDYRKVTPSIWYTPRENMKIGFIARFDMKEDPVTHPLRLHEFTVIMRAMF